MAADPLFLNHEAAFWKRATENYMDWLRRIAVLFFLYDPSSATYTKLKEFDTTHGLTPYGSLIQGANGKLYGLSENGGDDGYGVLFSYDPVNGTLEKYTDFDSTNGSYPYGDLIKGNGAQLSV